MRFHRTDQLKTRDYHPMCGPEPWLLLFPSSASRDNVTVPFFVNRGQTSHTLDNNTAHSTTESISVGCKLTRKPSTPFLQLLSKCWQRRSSIPSHPTRYLSDAIPSKEQILISSRWGEVMVNRASQFGSSGLKSPKRWIDRVRSCVHGERETRSDEGCVRIMVKRYGIKFR